MATKLHNKNCSNRITEVMPYITVPLDNIINYMCVCVQVNDSQRECKTSTTSRGLNVLLIDFSERGQDFLASACE